MIDLMYAHRRNAGIIQIARVYGDKLTDVQLDNAAEYYAHQRRRHNPKLAWSAVVLYVGIMRARKPESRVALYSLYHELMR